MVRRGFAYDRVRVTPIGGTYRAKADEKVENQQS